MSVESTAAPTSQIPNPAQRATVEPTGKPFDGHNRLNAFDSEDGPSFSDLLDIINPLQHIPIINTIYRRLTGDDEGAIAEVIGGTLYGGPLGLAGALFDIMVKDASGKHIGDLVASALFDDSDKTDATKVADAPKTPPTAAATSGTTEEPPPPAAAAVPGVEKSALDGADDLGKFLVFSPSGLTSGATGAGNTTGTTAAQRSDGPGWQGSYLVFGQQADAASISPARTAPQPLAPAASGASSASGATTQAVLAAHATATTATPKTSAAKSWPVPPHNGPASAPLVLPPPTTGPDAVPGGRPATYGRTGADDSSNNTQWFANAFNQAMDKYDRANRLRRQDDGNDDPESPVSATIN